MFTFNLAYIISLFLVDSNGLNFSHNAAVPGVCSGPGQVANADRYADSETFTAGIMVSYWCKDGARLEGSADLTCQSDGTWDAKPPSCLCDGKYP